MRTIDQSRRTPAEAEIAEILANNCIGEMTIKDIQRKMKTKYCPTIVSRILMDMGRDYQKERYEFIDEAIMAAKQQIKPIEIAYDKIADKIPFKIDPQTVRARLKSMNIDIFKDRDDFIKNNIVDILNNSDKIMKYQIPSMLRGREAYQSPPTVRRHLNEIRDNKAWCRKLKNPKHPALIATPR